MNKNIVEALRRMVALFDTNGQFRELNTGDAAQALEMADEALDSVDWPVKERSYMYEGKNGKREVTAPALSVVVPEGDKELAQFVKDANALRTNVEQKWTAWMDDREDGIVGTGSTEIEAIKALAEQHRSTH